MVDTESIDVPEISAEWYRDVVDAAARSPEPVRWFVGHATEGVILLLGALLLLAALSRWSGGPHGRALALIAPLPAVLAYAGSEWFKTVVDEERPCRTIGRAIIADVCPPTGDWSFPSNHATIAGALAVTTLLLSRRIGLVALPLAALGAFSRVFVGVHYPHDVIAGVLFGALVAVVATPLLTRPATEVLRRRAERADDPVAKLASRSRP
ncbi:phosphatase PAP2 family protein [Micromonospora sp. WMMD1120]|uniref:phosphatase PAP2 family protein n=1 Tax=Micromonospora sp. WMMD1120 TaxID=3016106 RepID=UPI002415F6AE|nr:phosphatase PAP2 family protein [Micromonospora sp. WMMD1120]MDG4807159.1 phosphatase PAP2 family protein [Micromonospora sp. WMMD1120]